MKKKLIMKSTIIVAFVAVASIITMGFNKSSYALPQYEKNSAPDKITRTPPAYSYVPSTASSGQVPNFEATSNGKTYKVFCLDRHGNYTNSEELTKGDAVPYALTYIAKKAIPYVNYASTDTTNKTCADAENIWIAQAAMWKYLDENNITTYRVSGKANLVAGTEEGDVAFDEGLDTLGKKYLNYYVAGTTNDAMTNCDKDASELWKAAKDLATEAKTQVDPSTNAKITLESDGKFDITDDKKYFKSHIIKLTSNVKVNHYRIDASTLPNGTKVYNQDANEITSLSQIDPNTSFYLLIPKESINEKTINFKVSVTGTIYYDQGYVYQDAGKVNQPVMLVDLATKDIEAALNLTVTESPDTASTISNSIYFIGFIILLSGAGIIYANVKPRKQESE